MNRTQLALAMGIAFLPLILNANAVEADENAKTNTESLILGANRTDPEKDATTNTKIEWDAQAGTVTARIDGASIEQVVHALEKEGVEVKAHDSWEQVRISASFDDLPLHEATGRLFGKSFMLVWSKEPSEGVEGSGEVGAKRPFIRLLPVVEGFTPASEAEPVAAKTSPDDVATLESLVESGATEQAVPALESALVDGDDQLRAAALELIGRQNILAVDQTVLRAVAHEDANPELRQQALKVFANRVHEPDASWDALNYSLHNDADPNVRDSARAALSDLSMRAAYLYKRDLGRGPSAEKP